MHNFLNIHYILMDWGILLAFTLSFVLCARVHIINLAVGSAAGCSAIAFIYAGNLLSSALGGIILAFAICAIMNLIFIYLIRLTKEHLHINDVLFSLFLLFILSWIARIIINIGPQDSINSQITPRFRHNIDLNIDHLVVVFVAIVITSLIIVRYSIWYYVTQATALNLGAFQLRETTRLKQRLEKLTLFAAALTLAVWVTVDMTFRTGYYMPGQYFDLSFLAISAGLMLSPRRPLYWIAIVTLLLAILRGVIQALAIANPSFPATSDKFFVGLALILALFAQNRPLKK